LDYRYESNDKGTNEDEHHADPVMRMQLLAEDGGGKKAGEENKRATEHLVNGGKGEEEANIEKSGGEGVASGGYGKADYAAHFGTE
jgi:hypothetical protein